MTFDKFKDFILLYKPIIEEREVILKKYINKIANDFYQQIIFTDVNNPFGGFNFLNMMRLVTSLAGGH